MKENCRSGSGRVRIGTEENLSISWFKAFSVSGVQQNLVFDDVRRFNGQAIEQ